MLNLREACLFNIQHYNMYLCSAMWVCGHKLSATAVQRQPTQKPMPDVGPICSFRLGFESIDFKRRIQRDVSLTYPSILFPIFVCMTTLVNSTTRRIRSVVAFFYQPRKRIFLKTSLATTYQVGLLIIFYQVSLIHS